MALRISMEEEKARQEKLSTNQEKEKDVDTMDLTEDEQMARALAMSMEVFNYGIIRRLIRKNRIYLRLYLICLE